VTPHAEQERREASVFTVWPEFEPLLGPLAHDLETVALAPRPGRALKKRHREMLRAVRSRDLALATLRGLFIPLLEQPPWNPLRPGQRVQDVGYTVGFHALLAYLRVGHPELSRRQADRYLAAMAEQGTLTKTDTVGIGFHLLYAVQRTSPALLVFHVPSEGPGKPRKPGKTLRYADRDKSQHLSLAPAARAQYGATWRRRLNVHHPMLVPPRPWSAAQRGGYAYALAESIPLISNVPALDADPVCPQVVYDTLNRLQETAWRINTDVLRIAQQRPDLLQNAEPEIMDAAADEADKTALYFVHALDCRGRIYPVGRYLTPQGPDFARALLQFGEGCTITAQDEPAITALQKYSDECKDKKPWQYRACCLELAAMKAKHDAREPFESHLAVWQDALASGFQHAALLLRDEKLAARVGLLPSSKPGDVYTDVAGALTPKLRAAAQYESSAAYRPLPRDLMAFADFPATDLLDHFGDPIPREVVKGPVMRFWYGEGKSGLKDTFEEEHGLDEAHNACFADALRWLLRDRAGVLAGVVRLRRWFHKVAEAIGVTGRPATWLVPGTKFPVKQWPFGIEEEGRPRFEWAGVEYRPRVNVRSAKLDEGAHITGLPPNVVHSLDAALLMLTVMRLPAGTAVGTVHDCFGTHAAVAPTLARAYSDACVQLYEAGQHPLDDLAEQFGRQCVKIPKMPKRGALRLSGNEEWRRARPLR
jgi:hypothetical protein